MNLSTLASYIPVQVNFLDMLIFLAISTGIVLVISILFRIFFGRKSAINKAISAGIGIVCIYVMAVLIYTFTPAGLDRFLVPLPFVKFSGNQLYLICFSSADLSVICSEIMSMVILVLLYNLTDSILPDGEDVSLLSWFVLRFITVLASMTVHYFVTVLTSGFLPDLLVSYGPTILLVCMIASLLVGVLGAMLGLLLVTVNPIVGILFAFFFSNKFGKQISKAMLTTFILAGLVALLNYLGCTLIEISVSSLTSYIPMLFTLLALWYFIARKL